MVNLVVKAIQVNITESLCTVSHDQHLFIAWHLFQLLSPYRSHLHYLKPLRPIPWLHFCPSVALFQTELYAVQILTGATQDHVDADLISAGWLHSHSSLTLLATSHTADVCVSAFVGLSGSVWKWRLNFRRHGSICSATAAWLYAETIKIQHLLS